MRIYTHILYTYIYTNVISDELALNAVTSAGMKNVHKGEAVAEREENVG